jgi:hypothetical protein
MTLPSGWIANPPAPETTVPPYTGDQTSLWMAHVNGNVAAVGIQPTSNLNPAGTGGSIPVMGMTAEAAAMLSGPQEG